jgi:hypothetical protein
MYQTCLVKGLDSKKDLHENVQNVYLGWNAGPPTQNELRKIHGIVSDIFGNEEEMGKRCKRVNVTGEIE